MPVIPRQSPWLRNDTSIYFNDGNVGIGVTDPDEALEINGNLHIDGDIIADVNQSAFLIGVRTADAQTKTTILQSNVLSSSNDAESGSNIILKGTQGGSNEDGNIRINAFGQSSHIDSNSIIFRRRISANTSVETARIDKNGNIGIGTTTPARLLHPEISDAITNAVTYALRLSHISSGTVAASFGIGIELQLEGADGTNLVAAAIEAIWTDPDTGAEDADLIFSVALAGAAAVEAARLKSNADFNIITGGAFQINDTDVLNATTLGSAIVNSSLTNLGILTALTVGSGTKHDGYIVTNAAEVQTTDATVTTLDTLTLLDENTYHVEAFIVGVKSDGTDRASYHLAATVYRTAAGGATIQGGAGGVTSLHTQESNAAWDADFTVSGNDLRLSVTGVAATTIEWSSTITYMNSSN